MLSTIWCLSRQAKNASRACQQWARRSRFGASKAPSGEGVGGGGEVCGGVVKRPILGGERGWCDGAAGGGCWWGRSVESWLKVWKKSTWRAQVWEKSLDRNGIRGKRS